jgi:hypothetical protein
MLKGHLLIIYIEEHMHPRSKVHFRVTCDQIKQLFTSTDSSGGSKLRARSNKARTFLSSFKRHRKSAYLNHSNSFNSKTIWLVFNVTVK